MLKSSKYNFYTFNDKEEMLLVNTFSGKMVKFPLDRVQRIDRYLKNLINDEDPQIDYLFDRGFLVDSEIDEGLKVRNAFTQIQAQSILVLIILPTEQCNFRCIYCPEEFERGKMPESVQSAIIDYVRKNIHRYTGLRISWFGGEPLLGMDVIINLSKALQQICRDKNRKFLADITTNAYLLNVETFRTLLTCNVLDYQITVDGLRKSHDKQRVLCDGSPTYNVIVNNLIQIKGSVKTGKFKILLRINVTKNMVDEFPDFIKWFKANFGDDRRFWLLVKMAGDFGGERVKHISDELFSKSGSENIFFDSMMKSDLNQCRLTVGTFFSVGGMLCTACMRNAFVIDLEGNIRKCTCRLEDNMWNQLGTILDGVIDTEKYEFLRWNEPFYDKKCIDCFLYPICMGSYCKYKSILSQGVCCPEEKRHISSYLRIWDKQGLFDTFDMQRGELKGGN